MKNSSTASISASRTAPAAKWSGRGRNAPLTQGFILGFLILAFDGFTVGAQQHRSAQEILEKSIKVMRELTHYSTTQTETDKKSGRKIDVKYYFRRNPDGEIEYRRERTRNGLTRVSLNLRNGHWRLFRGEALLMPSDGLAASFADQFEKHGKDSLGKHTRSQSFKKTRLDGRDCYLITETLDPGYGAAIADIVKDFDADSEAGKAVRGREDFVSTVVPARKEYYIGSEDFFLYAERVYGKNGAPVSDVTYDSAILNDSFSDDLFRIPDNMRKVRFETMRDMQRYMSQVARGNVRMPLNHVGGGEWKRRMILFVLLSLPVLLFVAFRSLRRSVG